MAEILQFLWTAFRAYWAAWVTGTGTVGLMLFVLSAFERKRGRSVSWRLYAAILFCVFWFLGTFSAWHDSQKNLKAVIEEKTGYVSSLGSCESNLSIQAAKTASWQDRFADQQKTINALQGPQLQQQATINSCVVSLGKMNPIITRKESVILVPYATKDANSSRLVNSLFPNKVYLAKLLIITNVAEIRPTGRLRCEQPFDVTSSPETLVAIASGGIFGMGAHKAISDREYDISVNNTGAIWDPTSPVLMDVSSATPTLGTCRFTPQ